MASQGKLPICVRSAQINVTPEPPKVPEKCTPQSHFTPNQTQMVRNYGTKCGNPVHVNGGLGLGWQADIV